MANLPTTPLVPPDVVEYAIYLDSISGLPPAEALAAVGAFCTTVLQVLSEYTNGYIWHREPFRLAVWDPAQHARFDTAHQHARQAHLYGRTAFGDNIEDEWFIVWLMLELTRRFPDATVRVVDSDGQFLLIEAADALPGWLQPENAEFRVWLKDGQVHIIPHARRDGEEAGLIPDPLDVDSALRIMQERRVRTLPSAQLERALLKRVANMPQEALQHNKHVSKAVLPLLAARVLAARPELVAPAVEAFYLRDHVDLRAANRMARLMPNPEQPDWVLMPVRFTRCLFAQLKQQQFHPPKHFRLPATLLADPKRRPAADIGVKLACGLEMLYQSAAAKRKRVAEQQQQQRGSEESKTVEEEEVRADDPEWLAFRGGLERRGYFENLLEGTPEHMAKLVAARDAFVRFRRERREQGHRAEALEQQRGTGAKSRVEDHHEAVFGAGALPNAADIIDSVLGYTSAPSASPAPSGEMGACPWRRLEELKDNAAWDAVGLDDDESWMYISPEELDAMLEERAMQLSLSDLGESDSEDSDGSDSEDAAASKQRGRKEGKPAEEESEAKRAARMVRGLVNSMGQFVQQESSHEGVEPAPPTKPRKQQQQQSPGKGERKAEKSSSGKQQQQEEEEDAEPEVSLDWQKVLRLLQGAEAVSAWRPAPPAPSGAPIAIDRPQLLPPAIRPQPDTVLAGDVKERDRDWEQSFNGTLLAQLREAGAALKNIRLPASDSEDSDDDMPRGDQKGRKKEESEEESEEEEEEEGYDEEEEDEELDEEEAAMLRASLEEMEAQLAALGMADRGEAIQLARSLLGSVAQAQAAAAHGAPNPVANILSQMGIKLPANADADLQL